MRRAPAGNLGTDPVVLLLLALVVTLLLGAVAYVVFVHPKLANPVMAAATVAAPLVAVLIAVLLRVVDGAGPRAEGALHAAPPPVARTA
ncbi:hypothetical protein ACFW9N_19610 [Streptomyces sp. NPDC059496]|uniref:hypothetical protein n=1 Tax=Streptomyces sp. NPDC059496 TaxID=3346851 RepID=UPI0036CC88F1